MVRCCPTRFAFLLCALVAAAWALGACGGAGRHEDPAAAAPSGAPAAPADVFRAACHVPADANAAPQSLLDTGCFAASGNAASGLYGYTVNGVLWADAADKQRWLWLPQGAQASFDGNNVLVLPVGGGVFKHFAREGKALETRLIFRDASDAYQSLTYVWNDAGTDATLVPAAGAKRAFADGSSWEYFSRSNCAYCHNSQAGTLLGPRVPQLSRKVTLASGATGNQLDDMVARGLLPSYDKAVVPWVEPLGDAPLNLRARSYLATNCAFCHLPGGASGTQVDWRYDTPLADTHACDVAPSWGSASVANAKVIAPGNPNASMASYRMHSAEPAYKMPPVGHAISDPNGTALVDAWIAAMTDCAE